MAIDSEFSHENYGSFHNNISHYQRVLVLQRLSDMCFLGLSGRSKHGAHCSSARHCPGPWNAKAASTEQKLLYFHVFSIRAPNFSRVGESLEVEGRTIMAWAETLLFALAKSQLWQSPYQGPIWVYAGFTVRQRHSCTDSVHLFIKAEPWNIVW